MAALFAVVLILVARPSLETIPLIVFVFLGAMMPDLDYHWGQHRKTFHNVWFLGACLLYLHYYQFPFWAGIFFVGGFASHLIADAMTVKGITPLYPLFGWKVKGPLKNGSWLETLAVAATAVVIAVTFIFLNKTEVI